MLQTGNTTILDTKLIVIFPRIWFYLHTHTDFEKEIHDLCEWYKENEWFKKK